MVNTTPTPSDRPRVPGSLGHVLLFGIPVRFHFTFWLGLAWLISTGVGGKQSLAGNTLFVITLFASVLLHEAGHALVARRFGIQTVEIVMLPLGGLTRLERQPSGAEEFWVSLAGPFVNFVLGGTLMGWTYWHGGALSMEHWENISDDNIASRLAVANLALALFNLLPAFPMDGGRVMRSLLAARRPYEEATRLTARLGTAIAAAMGLYGLLSANFLVVFLAFFVFVGATHEVMAVSTQTLMRGAVVRESMITDFRTLNHGNTLREAAELLLATSQQDFPVLTGSQTVGLLSRAALLRSLAATGPDGYVAGAMDREFVTLTPEMDLADAAPLMTGAQGCALVMEGEQLIGMLTTENLSEFLVLRQIRAARPAEQGQ